MELVGLGDAVRVARPSDCSAFVDDTQVEGMIGSNASKQSVSSQIALKFGILFEVDL